MKLFYCILQVVQLALYSHLPTSQSNIAFAPIPLPRKGAPQSSLSSRPSSLPPPTFILHRSIGSDDTNCDDDDDDDPPKPPIKDVQTTATATTITIERVSTKNRALDVRVLRRWSLLSAREYRKEQLSDYGVVVSHREAIDALTPSTMGDDGRESCFFSIDVAKPIVQFVAVVVNDGDDTRDDNGEDSDGEEDDDNLDRMNGVVGTVDAQVKKRPNGSSASASSSSSIYYPQVYLKNLSVDKDHRRRGIASSLVEAVRNYAAEEAVCAVVLHVDCENIGAARLYEREGFEHDEEEEEGGEVGRMVLRI
mmetsp:Transcript_20473/g.24403  ORF Transcript_20473/g.24403 Transcript_20473/m.24403 type:complete len:308 (-) Transcript_20473:426-1349(-)